MWAHWCDCERGLLWVADGEPCNWCGLQAPGKDEDRALVDAGYMPLAEYVRKYEAQDVSLPEDDDGRS